MYSSRVDEGRVVRVRLRREWSLLKASATVTDNLKRWIQRQLDTGTVLVVQGVPISFEESSFVVCRGEVLSRPPPLRLTENVVASCL